MRVRERGRQIHGETDRGLRLGLVAEPPAHDPEAEVGEGVPRLETRGLAIGLGRLAPASLLLEGQTEPEVRLDRAGSEIESGLERGDRVGRAPLLEENRPQVEMRGRRARPRLDDQTYLHFRFFETLLTTESGGEQRAELRIAGRRCQRAPTHRLRLRRAPVG